MSRDSTLVIDDSQGPGYRIEYRDKTSGEVRWVSIKSPGNYRNRYRNNYLVYDTHGDAVRVFNSRWEVGVFIAEQEGTYANHERMLEYMEESHTVKVTAPWAKPAEKKQMAKAYAERRLGQEVNIRKCGTGTSSDYYKVKRSVVPLKKARFSQED